MYYNPRRSVEAHVDPGDPGYDSKIGNGKSYKAVRVLPMGEFGPTLSLEPATTNPLAKF